MPRLFVALQLPDSLRQGVRGLQHGLRNARWLDEDAVHLTLAFVGEVDGSVQRRIEDALGNVTAPALRMELHGLGCFPPRGAPRVLWIGASPKAGLVSLARTVRRAIGHAGPAPERRKFMPHVTIARFRQPPPSADLERYLGAHSLFRTASADIGAFHLFSSMLRSSGARYTIEATFPLTEALPEGHDPASSRRPGIGVGDAGRTTRQVDDTPGAVNTTTKFQSNGERNP